MGVQSGFHHWLFDKNARVWRSNHEATNERKHELLEAQEAIRLGL